jgi:glycosyltransferase involved in cell wall biosynthesis
MIRVALVVAQRGWGGGEAQARLLARGLRARGHDCRILAREGTEFAARLAADGFAVEGFPGRGPRAMGRLRRLLQKFRPDVLHANDSHALTAAGVAAMGLKIPARVAARRTFFPRRWTRQYGKVDDRVIFVAGGVVQLCRAGGVPAEQLRVVRDGAEPRRAQSGDRRRGRAALGLNDSDPLLLTAANLVECKGHHVLLEALPRVTRRHPRLTLALAGSGPRRAPLEEQARALGVANNVRLLGFREDVPDLMRAADLFVLPSLVEGLGSVLIEAMLGGCPIVTTTAGGIPDLVGGWGDFAWTVPPGDAGALADALLAALEDDARRTLRRDRAQRRALANFTADRMVEETLAVYEELLRATRPARAA